LELVRALNAAGSYPTLEDVDKFARAEPPRNGYFGASLSAVYGLAFGRGTPEGEVGRYIAEAGLVHRHLSTNGVEISDLGRGLLAATNENEQDPASRFDPARPVEVVGRLSDPVVYARLLIEIQKLDEAILVDPYLPPDDLLQVVELGNVTKILTVDQDAAGIKRADRKSQLAIALGASQNGAELRLAADKKDVHDRVALPLSGQGLMIGTSLGGTHITVITHLSEASTVLLRDHYLGVFRSAKKLEPVKKAPVADLSVAES